MSAIKNGLTTFPQSEENTPAGVAYKHARWEGENKMAQIKIYGVKQHLNRMKDKLSDTIHSCFVEAINLPADKRFHRFFPLERAGFFFPPDRSDKYTIIEISLFEGRSVETKKQLIRLLFEKIGKEMSIAAQDIEITIFETPSHNWGIRGKPGDELVLSYKVEV
jgi:phenylpyruvate tautomerase PptA (4-oxalocrotonate tautomerase family)